MWNFIKKIGSGIAKSLPIIGPTIGSLIGAKSAKDTNQAQINQSNNLFNKQKQETDTAHQREIADLKAAGLNPILSAKYGGSASATGTMPNLKTPFENAGRDFSSAAQIHLNRQMTKAQIQNIQAMSKLNSASAIQKREQAQQARLLTDRMRTTQPTKTSWGKKWILSPIREAIDTINPLRGMFGGAK